MKIARVEALHADGGWRPWTFVRIETDTGLVGWGECSDNRSPYGIAGSVRDLASVLVGQDPRPVERLYWDMLRATRQNYGGVSFKAMAGIELALWDIKAKALGVPVYELFGGPLRDRMRLYWSHCGTTRARMGSMLGTPPLKTYDDIAALGREVVARGFTALKTNMVIPGDPATVYFPGFASGINTTDGAPTVEILEAIDRLFLEKHAVDVAIIDVPWNGFSPSVQIGRLAEACEINIAPHNYYSHLADLHALHLCAVLPNVRIMEIDIDDVPWKGTLVTRPPEIRDGHIWLTDAPGWGADVNEKVLAAHPWPRPGETGPRLFYGMDPAQMTARP